jgi:hypothetical protein
MTKQADLIFKAIQSLPLEELQRATNEAREKVERLILEIDDLESQKQEEIATMQLLELSLETKYMTMPDRDKERFVNITLKEAAIIIISEAGGKMHVRDLTTILRGGGFPFKTTLPDVSVDTILSREKDTFEKVKPRVFRLIKDRAE